MEPILDGNRIKLRKLKISDSEVIRDFAKDKKITKYTFVTPPPFTKKQAQDFISKVDKERKKGISYYFGIELKENRKLIGMMNLIKIDQKNKNAEVGFWIAGRYQCKGLAKEALNLILDFGFKKLKLRRIEARVLHKNKPAQKLLEKTGFKLEGKLRKKTFFKNQWFDDLIYGILRN
jgi:ribosomal-protein-alanine N-acetyltransferase